MLFSTFAYKKAYGGFEITPKKVTPKEETEFIRLSIQQSLMLLLNWAIIIILSVEKYQ